MGGAARVRAFTFLQLMLLIVLPLLFIVSLFIGDNILYLIFCALSVLTLMATWLLSAFIPNARATMTIVHISLIVIALFAVLISAPKDREDDPASTQLAPSIGAASSSSLSEMLSQSRQNTEEQEVAPTEDPYRVSDAQRRLEEFMSAWQLVDYKQMAALCYPPNQLQESDREAEMFHLRANRSVDRYDILDISGNDSNGNRTAQMHITINKNNGNPSVTYLFQIMLTSTNGEWYVDPGSLGAVREISTESENRRQAVIATIVPTPVPDPKTLLYYNPKGGRLYHKDNNCTSILPEYLPLTASFYYEDVNNGEFAKLSPCGTCGAPGK